MSLRILAVDDDALILINLVDMLEDLGHTVVAATSARQALDHLATSSFDVLMTDHAMPQMTGAQLIRAVRASYPGVAVLLATGYAALPPDEEGDFPLLAKPYSLADLELALQSAQL